MNFVEMLGRSSLWLVNRMEQVVSGGVEGAAA